jgi:putative chitinase
MHFERFREILGPFALVTIGLLPAEGVATTLGSGTESSMVVNINTIANFSPRARADVVATILKEWQVAIDAGISTPLRVHHFIAQLATETGGFRLLEENLNYSAERLLQIFPRRVSREQARQLANNPIAIANHVYNGRLGNLPPMDGWTFRGSGLIQLTGRINFVERGRELGFPLETNPDLARSPSGAFFTAVAYWKARNISTAADANDLNKVRRLVNGGSNGLAESRIWLARARQFFVDPTSKAVQPGEPSAEEKSGVEEKLKELGYLEPTPEKSYQPDDVSTALRRFQESKGLPITGRYDEETLYQLTDPDQFRVD